MEPFETFTQALGISPEKADMLFRSVDSMYSIKRIPKKSGGERELNIPKHNLKLAQKMVYKYLSRKFQLPSCAHGGIVGKSIITNAKVHSHKEFVANYDLKDFFPSVHPVKIERALRKHFDFSLETRRWLVRLVTYENQLPQGASTSPFFANLVAYVIDMRIKKLCKNGACSYTRYFDDITISGGDIVKDIHSKKIVESIVAKEGFLINRRKTKLAHKTEPQYVTGIIVNKGLSLDEKFLEQTRTQIDSWECFLLDKEKEVVAGKIAFAKSVNLEMGKDLEKYYKAQEVAFFTAAI